jgi:hypothetical protein
MLGPIMAQCAPKPQTRPNGANFELKTLEPAVDEQEGRPVARVLEVARSDQLQLRATQRLGTTDAGAGELCIESCDEQRRGLIVHGPQSRERMDSCT